MKKLFPIAIIAVFGALTLSTSCTKKTSTSYTCSCTLKLNGSTDTTIKFAYGTVSQASASSTCSTQQSQYQTIDPAASCHL